MPAVRTDDATTERATTPNKKPNATATNATSPQSGTTKAAATKAGTTVEPVEPSGKQRHAENTAPESNTTTADAGKNALVAIPAFRGLLSYLNSLTGRANAQELEFELRNCGIDFQDLADCCRFSGVEYLRIPLILDSLYEVVLIGWRSGQRTPIHNHPGSTCGVRVLQGIATETIFQPTPAGVIKAVTSADVACNGVMTSSDDDIHQISNTQAKGQDLVTLHVCSPPLRRMDTFSITSTRIGEYRRADQEPLFSPPSPG